jgi:hypothetical protein
MTTMTVYAINLFILCVLVLIAGLIKPKWILFWMDNPSRLMIQAIGAVLFMGAAILFGEGVEEKKAAELAVQQKNAPPAKPAPVAPPPAQPADTPTNELRL